MQASTELHQKLILADARFAPGNVWFVQSTHANAGDSAGKGQTPDAPFSTIDYAVGQCTADQGDLIIVLPGHVETVIAAAGLDLDVAGITIIGIGNGNLRPQINFTTATTADMDVDAANITMDNFRFTGGFDALAGPIDINAASFTLRNFITEDVTGQAVDFIVTDANADYLTIEDWEHRGASGAGADTALSIVGGDHITVRNFAIFGNFAVAAIENVTTACVNLSIYGDVTSFIQNGLDSTTPVAVTLVSTSTGFVGPNIYVRLGVDSTSNTVNITEAFVGAAMQFMQPLAICNLGGEVAMNSNITATTDA